MYGNHGASDHEIAGFTDTDLETLKQEGYLITSAPMTALKAKAHQQNTLHTQHAQSPIPVKPLPLEKDHEDLLSAVVEAYRNMPRELRQPFIVRTTDESYNAEILHQGFPDGNLIVYEGDIKVLGRYELLAVSYGQYGVSNTTLI